MRQRHSDPHLTERILSAGIDSTASKLLYLVVCVLVLYEPLGPLQGRGSELVAPDTVCDEYAWDLEGLHPRSRRRPVVWSVYVVEELEGCAGHCLECFSASEMCDGFIGEEILTVKAEGGLQCTTRKDSRGFTSIQCAPRRHCCLHGPVVEFNKMTWRRRDKEVG